METTLLEHGFDISPTTVYGVLVVILAIANVMQYRTNRMLVETIIKLNQDSVATMHDFIAVAQNTMDAVNDVRDRILDKLIGK